MSDFREKYLEWVLSGGDPAQRPAASPLTKPVPMGSGGAPMNVPMRPDIAAEMAKYNANPPRSLVAPREIPSGPVTRGVSPWQMMKAIPGGLMDLAPGVAGYAGGAAALHLANPPDAGDPREDQMMLERYLNSPDLPTVQVKPPVNSQGGTPVTAMPTTTPQKTRAYQTPGRTIPATQDVKSAAANGISPFETEDPRVKKRLEEREQIKREMAVPIESIQDLRLKARMMREH